jgi:hypothetical protein
MLLWFLPLALIPIALHLITLLRLRTVEISTFRFLMDGYVQQRRRVRLLEYVVMLLRFAFIVLIVFLLARPVVDRFSLMGSGGSRDVTIVVDAGASMALTSGGTTSMQRAIDAAGGVVGMLGRRDHVRVIAAGRQPEVVAEGFASNPERMVSRIREISPALGQADLAAALDEAGRSETRGAPYLFLVTDGLHRKWSRLEGHPALARLNPEAETVVMNIGPTEPVHNLAVVGDPPRERSAMKGLPVLLTARLANGSTDRDAETVLSVILEDETVRQVPLTLPPGGGESVTLDVTPARGGAIRGRFETPGDAFPDDNVFRFVLNAQERLSVLVITGPKVGGGEVNRGELTEDPLTYLETALRTPLLAGSEWSEREQQVAGTLDVSNALFDEIDEAQLQAADVVILADAPVNAELGEQLRRYAGEGGGLLVLPGRHVDANRYNTHLLRPGVATSGLSLAPPTGDVDDESRFTGVARVRLSHPVMQGFATDHEEKRYFSTLRISRRFGLRVGEAQPGTRDADAGIYEREDESDDEDTEASPRRDEPVVLLEADDGSPLLIDAPLGSGRVMVSAVPATPGWSSLPLGREFVPLMIRAMPYLQRLPDVDVDAAVPPGRPAVIRITPRWPNASAEAVDPTGRRHAIKLSRSGDRLVGALLATDHAGYYTIEVSPNAENAPPLVEAGFAVNALRCSAGFASISEQDAKAWLDPLKPTYLAGTAEDPVLTRRLTERQEIWRTLIWITLAVIGVEFFLATLRPSAPGQTRTAGSLAGRRNNEGGGGPMAAARGFAGQLRATLSGSGRAASNAAGSSTRSLEERRS